MAESRKLAPYRSAVHRMGKQLLDKSANMVAPGVQQGALLLLQELVKLRNVRRIGRDGQRRQSLLDLQIIEKPANHGRAGVGRHVHQYARYRTLRKVPDGIREPARKFLRKRLFRGGLPLRTT